MINSFRGYLEQKISDGIERYESAKGYYEEVPPVSKAVKEVSKLTNIHHQQDLQPPYQMRENQLSSRARAKFFSLHKTKLLWEENHFH